MVDDATGHLDTAPGDPPHPFTDTGLARLMLCQAYQEVAESALSGMSTHADPAHHPGEHIEAARQLIREAEDTLCWAVIYERERGTSWEDIGEALGGITKQSAHKKHAADVHRWRAPLTEPAAYAPDGTPRDPRIPYPASDPEPAAAAMDAWLRDHTGPTDAWHGKPQPVSGTLDRHTTLSALIITEKVSSRLLTDQMVPDPQAQAAVAERRADLMARLVREGEATADTPAWIAKERARAAALRATPGRGTPWPQPTAPNPPAPRCAAETEEERPAEETGTKGGRHE